MFERLDLRGSSESSPYRGLFRFEPEDRAFFFGRRDTVKDAIGRLVEGFHTDCPFLLIRGQSGVGKSSLARAGILGNLEQLQDYGEWTTAILDLHDAGDKPPLSALAASLVKVLPSLVSSGLGAAALARLDPRSFAAKIAGALPYHTEASLPHRLLLLIDQLERLFPIGNTGIASPKDNGRKDARGVFAQTLTALVESKAAWIIATMRREFLPKIDDCSDLLALARGRDFLLRPPRREELKEMILEPMKLWGFTPGVNPNGRSLVEILLDEAEGPGSLPLLEYTLDELVRQFDRDRRLGRAAPDCRTLSWDAYERLGGLTGAIGRRVDAEFEKLDGLALHRPGLDALIRSLTQIDHQSREPIARQARLDDLAGIDARLIELMVDLRLLLVDGMMVRVAHEALLTKWSVARETLERDGDALLLRDALEQQSARWQAAPAAEKGGYLLPVGGQLTDAVDLLRRCQQELPRQIVSFIEASQEQRQKQIRIAEARLAADDQRSLDHISAGEFQEAALKLQEITTYLQSHLEPGLASRESEFSERWTRIRRLAGFYAAAREADTLAGEEDFDKALPKCREALQQLDIDDPSWWDKLPTQDLAASPNLVSDLEQEIYRTLLRYGALQLVPGINLLWPRRAPAAAVPTRRINLTTLAGPILSFLLPIVGPSLLRLIARRGGLWRFRLLGRQDRKEALVEFEKIRLTLAKIREVEERLAMRNEDGNSGSSRTSQFIHRLVDFFVELASPPKDAPIDYRQWLQSNWDGPPQDPINAVDYFFIGLLNYFVAKRRETLIPKALALVRGQFPYIDDRTPLETANRLLRSAVALDPKNFWAHWLLGRTLLTAKDYAGAELAFHAAVALRPSYARGYEQRALAIAHQWAASKDDRLRRRALKDSEDARKKFANGDPSIFWPRGELFQLLGDMRGALDAYARWLELEEDIPSLIARAGGLAALHRTATRLRWGRPSADPVRRALHADAFAVRALVRSIWLDYNGALEDAAAALQLAPRHVHALTAKGMILRRQRKPEAALEALELAATLAPSRDEPELSSPLRAGAGARGVFFGNGRAGSVAGTRRSFGRVNRRSLRSLDAEGSHASHSTDQCGRRRRLERNERSRRTIHSPQEL